jgi:photosystem II stability/assembly factor-like uncharacterized protein
MQVLFAAIAIAVVHGHCVHCLRPYKLGEMQFVGPANGWATAYYTAVSDGHVSQYTALVHTLDGGKHWRPVPDIETYQIEPAFWFLDSKIGWVTWPEVVREDYLIRTRDGGRTWRNLRAPGFRVHLRFFTERSGVGAESTSEGALFCSTTNGGIKWREQPVDLVYPDVFQFLNANIGWLGGVAPHSDDVFRPRILYTLDGGRTWSHSSMPAGIQGDPHDMFFVDQMHGWLILWNGIPTHTNTLLRTVDGGQSWQQVPMSHQQLDAVRFLSDRTGFVFVADGDTGAVLSTTDGGETWQRQSLPSPIQSCTIVEDEIWCGAGMDLVKVKSR